MRSTSLILVALLLAAWCLAAPSVQAQESARTQACIKCHVKPPERAPDQRIFQQDRWEVCVHAALECIECHPGADAKAFDVLPHRLGAPPPSCADCHEDDFKEMAEELARSGSWRRTGPAFNATARP